MSEIIAERIFDTVKQLCLLANIKLPVDDYKALTGIFNSEDNYASKTAISQILQNAKIANETQRPLCQDTGFVTVFLSIGQNVRIIGENINNVINNAVKSAYEEYFLRKSIVDDAVFKRINTTNNTPVLIHTEIIEGDNIEIILSIKGGGCENISAVKMLTPAQGIDGVKDFVIETIKSAGANPCPPIKVGIGIGSNFEGAAILSKKALLGKITNEKNYLDLSNEIFEEINKLNIGVMGHGGKNTCYGVNILSAPCHIASLPVAISVSCHSNRHASAVITEKDVKFEDNNYEFISPKMENTSIKINTFEIDKIRNLETETNIELSGTIYTARDAAHKKLQELINEKKELPFNIKNSIIFYAGPCPASKDEIIGPIGPTTSIRMDKYTTELYKRGLLATIGKGDRSPEVQNVIKKYNGKYFTITGGIASLLKNRIKSAKIIAYKELGTEAIYELEVKNLPLIVKV